MIKQKEAFQLQEDGLRKFIDQIYTTPLQLLEELEKTEGEERYEMWISVQQKFVNLESSFYQYLHMLIISLSLDNNEQAELVEKQYSYTGPIEMLDYLQALHARGYYLELSEDNLESSADNIEVRSDYSYLVDNIEFKEEDEGIRRFLTFLTENIDIRNYGISVPNKIEIPWYEYDEILLEMEDIYIRIIRNIEKCILLIQE